jgi:hypothetical protein
MGCSPVAPLRKKARSAKLTLPMTRWTATTAGSIEGPASRPSSTVEAENARDQTGDPQRCTRGGLARLEQAQEDGQRDERPHEACYAPLAGTGPPRDRVRDSQCSERHHRIDKMEDFPRATATGNQPETARRGQDEREKDELFEAFGGPATRRAPQSSPGALEPDEHDRKHARERTPVVKLGRDGQSSRAG